MSTIVLQKIKRHFLFCLVLLLLCNPLFLYAQTYRDAETRNHAGKLGNGKRAGYDDNDSLVKFLRGAGDVGDDRIKFRASLGDASIAGNGAAGGTEKVNFLSVNVFNFDFTDSVTGLWLSVSPYKYLAIQRDSDSEWRSKQSIVNLDFSYNLQAEPGIVPDDHFSFLGPFVSVNYLIFDDNKVMDYKDVMFSAGMRYSMNLCLSDRFYMKAVSFETGYRNMDHESMFYVNVSIDNLVVLGALAAFFLLFPESID